MRDLVIRAQQGDLEAFSTLTVDRSHRLYATARLVLRDDDAAADAVQDALVDAWRDIRALRDPARFDAWLYRLLVRTCHRSARRSRLRTVAEIAVANDRHEATDDVQDAVADRDQLARAFRRLTIDERTVLVLRHYVGLSVPEIADVLRIPLGTAKARLSRASGAMRSAVEADARTPSTRTEVSA